MSKKVMIFIGIVLIILQIVSFYGMSTMRVGLYPDKNDLPYWIKTDDSCLNIRKVIFAMEAGFDRFKSGFEDLTYSETDYRIMTATQVASAMVRESLGCSNGGSSELIIYDSLLFVSFSITGLLGSILLVIANRIHTDDTNIGISNEDEGEKE